MKNINIKGTIVSNDDKDIYDWIGWESTSPSDIAVMLEDANGEDVTFVVNGKNME